MEAQTSPALHYRWEAREASNSAFLVIGTLTRTRQAILRQGRATNGNAHELSTPESTSEVPQGEFPWRSVVAEGGANSPSPLASPGSLASQKLDGIVSPVSSPSPGLPSPIPNPSMIPSPLPSPLPVVQPQPQRHIRPDLITADSSQS